MNLTARDVLIYMTLKYEGNYLRCVDAIRKKEAFDHELYDALKNKLDSNVLTLMDDLYPVQLKEIPKPPLALFYHGNISLLKNKVYLSLVGSRHPSIMGIDAVKKVLEGIEKYKDKVCLISGMAYGIDEVASKEFMKKGMNVISVLGSGINNIYPQTNRDIYEYCKTERGLIISEYPSLVEARSEHFPFRNRIIASLGDVILIGESKERSGTSITANYACDFGKDIYCIPTSILNSNTLTNSLIKDGAYLCSSFTDFINNLLSRYKEIET